MCESQAGPALRGPGMGGGLSPVEVATPFFGGRQGQEQRREKRGFHHVAVQNLEKQVGD